MLCIKLLSLLVAILYLMPGSQAKDKIPVGCENNKLCPSDENTIFTTDGRDCFVIRNDCYLLDANCNRLIKGLRTLSLTTKEACQAMCKTTCGTIKLPVCGEYRGTYTKYDNACLLLQTACVNGQAILNVRNRACPIKS
ncbi:hypothetical protein DOY81_001470 [Sarcophaga bullata]|nr:hypothetical protein DOY81_001470 [Sarcophaga bullata]